MKFLEGLIRKLHYAVVAGALLLPAIAVPARRLHDITKGGWWTLATGVPLLCALVVLYWYLQPGQAGANEKGCP